MLQAKYQKLKKKVNCMSLHGIHIRNETIPIFVHRKKPSKLTKHPKLSRRSRFCPNVQPMLGTHAKLPANLSRAELFKPFNVQSPNRTKHHLSVPKARSENAFIPIRRQLRTNHSLRRTPTFRVIRRRNKSPAAFRICTSSSHPNAIAKSGESSTSPSSWNSPTKRAQQQRLLPLNRRICQQLPLRYRPRLPLRILSGSQTNRARATPSTCPEHE